jgi:hypothetical protein
VVSVTVQASVPDPVMAPLLQERALNAAGAAVPVPVSPITAVEPFEELLLMLICPEAAAAVAGSNSTYTVTAWPGFRVAGKLAAEIEKPVPATVIELTVTGAVPVDVRMTDCVAEVFTCTLPKGMLVALMLSVGTAAFSCRAKILATPPEVAVSVAAWAVETDAIVAVNPALVALAGMVIMAGTVTAALLLDRLTLSPPAGAAAVSVTVQASVPDPVMVPLLQERALNAAGAAVPVPLSPITAVEPFEELLLMLI